MCENQEEVQEDAEVGRERWEVGGGKNESDRNGNGEKEIEDRGKNELINNQSTIIKAPSEPANLDPS